jgi:membrane-bound serine protease (ClpP class)
VTDPKTINFLVTNLEANLAKHGRNESLAHAFVVNNLNLEASQAVEFGATEIVADSVRDLRVQADGRTTHFKNITLDVADARVVTFEPSLALTLLVIISDPVISGLLLIIGLYAIVFGVSAPGHGAEIFGVIVLIIALIGIGIDVDPLAIFLILLGVAFLVVEVYNPGFGAFGAGGIVAIVLGTILLAPIRPPEFVVAPDYQVTVLLLLIIPTAAVGVFLLFALYKVLEARRREPVFGGMLGKEAKTVDAIGPAQEGYVMYEAELWKATAVEEIPAEETVYIHERDGPVLTVGREPPVAETVKVPIWRRLLPRRRSGAEGAGGTRENRP